MPKLLVLHVNAYSFPDKDNPARQVTGCSALVLDGTVQDRDGRVGAEPTKLNVEGAAVRDFARVPGFYDVDYDVRPGPGGKAKVVVAAGELVRAWDIQAEFAGLAA